MEPEKKKVNRVALGFFGVGLMLFNYWLYTTGIPFKHYAVMAPVLNGILGLGFARVYITMTQKRDDE